MTESAEARLKRLKMRSMRRGIKEMDILLSAFAEARLAGMGDAELALYDAMLSENDQEIYAWILGQEPVPERYAGLVADISEQADALMR